MEATPRGCEQMACHCVNLAGLTCCDTHHFHVFQFILYNSFQFISIHFNSFQFISIHFNSFQFISNHFNLINLNAFQVWSDLFLYLKDLHSAPSALEVHECRVSHPAKGGQKSHGHVICLQETNYAIPTLRQVIRAPCRAYPSDSI